MKNLKLSAEFWQNKKILLTGHTGFKGTWLSMMLLRLGADVTGYALEPGSEPNIFSLCKPDIKSVIGDIRNFDKLFKVFSDTQPEIVIHMAAQPLVLESYREPRYTYDVNVMGTVNVLECVRICNSVKSVLNVTTDKVYLNRERFDGYTEDEQLCGSDPYSNSKSCSELVTSTYFKSFLKDKDVSAATVRSGNVIGGGDFSVNRIIPDCARMLSEGKTIGVRNPDSTRPYQHVLDTLFAYLLVIEKHYENIDIQGTYNIGPGDNDCVTTGQIAGYFCDAWGEIGDNSNTKSGKAGSMQKAKWEHTPTDDPPESRQLRLNCDKIRRELGWSPKWDIKRAVYETAMWYKAYCTGGDYMAVTESQINEFLM